MPNRLVISQMAADVAAWQADGLISPATAKTLAARWVQPNLGALMWLRHLGMAGGLLLACGLLGMLAAIADSAGFGLLLAAVVAVALFTLGLRLAKDDLSRFQNSSKIILALAVLSLLGALGLLGKLLDWRDVTTLVFAGTIAVSASFYVAYRHSNIFVLILALLQLLHWIGSLASMVGRSSYVFEIQDPAVMAVVATAVVAAGLLLHRKERPGQERFSLVYQSLGLTYLNLSFLHLTLQDARNSVGLIVLFAVVGLGQIVVGSRLHKAVILSFGVISLALNTFTRYFERFWEQLDVGLFFLLGGCSLFAVAAVCEKLLRPSLEGKT